MKKIFAILLALLLITTMAVPVMAASEYDYESYDGPAFDFGKYALIAFGIGLVIGLIVVLILRGQLKTVRKQNQANNYVRPGSMNLTISNDIYLYSNVIRTRRQTNNN